MNAQAERLRFDLQVNGFAGIDFQQDGLTAEQLEIAMLALGQRRTRILLTLITDRIEALCARLENIEALRRRSPLASAIIAGYHLEGPYLLPDVGYHGAHDPRCMKAPDVGEFDRLQRAAGGGLRLVTLAPEWAGSMEFIRHARASGVRLAIGHSNASDAVIDQAIAAGLTHCTHLGNGVPMHLPRHDNVIQRLLARDELHAVFIPDGIHLTPVVLKNFVRAKPRDKVLFTTDCMAAADAPPGRYRLGRLEVEVAADGVVREPGRPNFAGSSLTMDRAEENVLRWLGWSEAEAADACGAAVLRSLGIAEIEALP